MLKAMWLYAEMLENTYINTTFCPRQLHWSPCCEQKGILPNCDCVRNTHSFFPAALSDCGLLCAFLISFGSSWFSPEPECAWAFMCNKVGDLRIIFTCSALYMSRPRTLIKSCTNKTSRDKIPMTSILSEHTRRDTESHKNHSQLERRAGGVTVQAHCTNS